MRLLTISGAFWTACSTPKLIALCRTAHRSPVDVGGMKTSARGRAVERFRDNRLFEGVDADIIERIAPKLGVLRKKPGEIIFREGEPGRSEERRVGKECRAGWVAGR